MTYRLQILWKVFSDIPSSTSIDSIESAPSIFQKRTSKSLLREIGSNAKDTVVPCVLEPTHVFYNALRKVLQENEIEGKKFPFVFPLSLGPEKAAPTRVNLAIRLYGRFVCISVESDSFEVPDDIDLARVKQLESHEKLLAVVRFVISIVRQGSRYPKADGDGVRILPCLQIISGNASLGISEESLVALVTGHAEVNSSVVADLISRNRDHQIDKTSLLSDKQGLVFYAPPQTGAPAVAGMARRFRSAAGMVEVAVAVQLMIRGVAEISQRDFLAIERLVCEPELVFADSVSGRKLWDLLSSEFKLPIYLSKKRDKMQISKPKNKIKILCIAAAPIEFASINKLLKSELGEGKIVKIGEGKNFDPVQSYLDARSGTQWYIASQDSQGNGSATIDVGRLAQRIQPDHVIMVGMCMALPHSELPPGTVVVPDALFSLEHQRATTTGTEFRPRGMEGNSGLQRLAKLIPTNDLGFKVVFGKKLASASVKIEDPKAEIVEYLQNFAKDVVAFDMEGWGFYKGAEEFSCLWIKAVADAGERQATAGEGRDDKQSVQADVTTNAIRFAFDLIRQVAEMEPFG
jgi:nucleoside phosphorylase